ncbi:RB1-inducible coiled-coil, partial [Desmophyllum pertusum]
CGTDAVLEEDYQQRIQLLEGENRKLTETFSEQTGGDRSAMQGGQLKQALDAKDQQIKILQQQLSQMQQLAGAAAATSRTDKISLRDFQIGDLILLVFDERYENYLVLSTGQTLFFLHPESMTGLDLATSGPKRRPWMLAQMTDKEYCQAKKPHNRFHVPVGTKFYRIQAKPCER